MQKIYPLPEAIDGHQWIVERGVGSINTVDRRLQVPLSDSETDRMVRNHETAHARLTPRHPATVLARKYAISPEGLQAVEDLRVHLFLKHCDISSPGVLTQEEMDSLVGRCHFNRREVGLLLVAGLHTDDFDRAINSLRNHLRPEDLADIGAKVQLIEKRLKAGRSPFRRIGFRNCTAPAAQLADALFPETAERDGSAATAEIPKQVLECVALQPKSPSQHRWGTLAISHLPQSLTRVVSPYSQCRTYRDEGAALAAPYRLPVDRRIFAHKKRVKGGTVLIDGSGSMRITDDDIRRILAVAPAATVAIYSGHRKEGTLTVIAAKGRAVTTEGLAQARCGSGNVVDGPALQWLAKQPEPRLWVSDGVVTGVHDRVSIDLWAEAATLCRTHRITRVEKAAAVEGFLRASTHRLK